MPRKHEHPPAETLPTGDVGERMLGEQRRTLIGRQRGPEPGSGVT